MKRIIYNNDNLDEEEITSVVVRAKALLIQNNSILLGYEKRVLQFPGGHLEVNETLDECLKREVLEETGIELDSNEIGKPFLQITHLHRDYPEKGQNRQTEIYYYVVRTNKEVDLSKVHYTKEERMKDFKVIRVDLKDVIDIIKNNIKNNELNKVIAPDMIVALEYYFNNGGLDEDNINNRR